MPDEWALQEIYAAVAEMPLPVLRELLRQGARLILLPTETLQQGGYDAPRYAAVVEPRTAALAIRTGAYVKGAIAVDLLWRLVGADQLPFPVKLIDEEAAVPTMAPALGQHTDDVLRDVLGYDDDTIAAITTPADPST